jgi:hypothetical protein
MKPLHEIIRLRALELVHNPIRSELVYAQLGSDFVQASKEDYHLVVEQMIKDKQIIELEYIIDGNINSILFPFNCDLKLKFDFGVHSFIRKEV